VVVEVAAGEVVSEGQCTLRGPDRVRALSELGVNVVICGAASRELEERLLASGLGLVPDIRGSVAEVIRAYIEGQLTQPGFSMPGCQTRPQRGRTRRSRPARVSRRK